MQFMRQPASELMFGQGNSRGLIMQGKRFGKLVILERKGSRSGRVNWLCKCDCGNQTEVISSNLNSGNTISCGCFKKEASLTHGASKDGKLTPTYMSWKAMKSRCNNPKNMYYKYYGAKGIVVYSKWLNSFEQFLFDMGERPVGKTLDRIDNNKNYEPFNCRWATDLEQVNNRG